MIDSFKTQKNNFVMDFTLRLQLNSLINALL